MSRSYKRTPVSKIASNYDKKLAARKVRRLEKRNVDISNGSSYKKYYPQYSVCDVWSYRAWEDEVKWLKWMYYGGFRRWSWVGKDDFLNEDGSLKWNLLYNDWKKWYYRK